MTALAVSDAAGEAGMRIVPFDALGAAELDAWHGLRAANPALDSPYFHPGFAAAVQRRRPTGGVARSAVGRGPDGGAIAVRAAVVALVAYHRERPLLRPAGWPAADFQGPVLAPGTGFRRLRLLRRRWCAVIAFDHLLDRAPGFEP